MSLRLLILFLAFFLLPPSSTQALTTSIIIPCCSKHAPHLFDLLKAYEQQTELPDEIIISLSQYDQVPCEIINKLQQEKWLFPVTLLLEKDIKYPGENRNNACIHATSDILICQDADDVIHPQRVEITKYLFETYHLNHLLHKYRIVGSKDTIAFETYSLLNQLPIIFPKSYREANRFSPANGYCAIAAQVFKKIKWSNGRRGEDVDFNRRVYAEFNNCAVVSVALLAYRTYLSSSKKARDWRKTREQRLKDKQRHRLAKAYVD